MFMDSENASRASLISMAERELGSFISAVTELYGRQQAEISAGEWLDELESMDGPAEPTLRSLRQVTIAAAARLATRVITVAQHALSSAFC